MTPASPIAAPRIDWIPLALLGAVALAALAMIGNPSTWVTLTIAGLAMGLLLFPLASGLPRSWATSACKARIASAGPPRRALGGASAATLKAASAPSRSDAARHAWARACASVRR